MKVSFDEIFAAIGMSVMAYFTYKTLNGKSAIYEEYLKDQINNFSKKIVINSTYGKFTEDDYKSVPVH